LNENARLFGKDSMARTARIHRLCLRGISQGVRAAQQCKGFASMIGAILGDCRIPA
jgi:hypothetical protein